MFFFRLRCRVSMISANLTFQFVPTPRGLGGGGRADAGHPPRRGLVAGPSLAEELGLGGLSGQLDVMGAVWVGGIGKSFCM